VSLSEIETLVQPGASHFTYLYYIFSLLSFLRNGGGGGSACCVYFLCWAPASTNFNFETSDVHRAGYAYYALEDKPTQ
jgi:hypothetical protein